MKNPEARKVLADARRVVVKIGSRALVQKNGRPDVRRIRALVNGIAALRKQGREVVVVSSGAIAAGVQALGLRRRPTDLPSLQMAAAIGQSRLMALYARYFTPKKFLVAQVLLTHDDLRNRRRHLAARNTALKLLEQGVIPIINENDVIADEEIRFGDNDALASRTSMLVDADLLILLTVVNGFHQPDAKGRSRRVPLLESPSAETLAHAKGRGSPFSTGGMASKLQSAMETARLGVNVVIANGREDGILEYILGGKDVGTLIPAGSTAAAVNRRRRWVTYFHHPRGILTIDDGARDALLQKGKSLLPVGIRAIEGKFNAGDLVKVCALDGTEIACGLSERAADELRLLMGRPTREIQQHLGEKTIPEAIHRDNLVLT